MSPFVSAPNSENAAIPTAQYSSTQASVECRATRGRRDATSLRISAAIDTACVWHPRENIAMGTPENVVHPAARRA
jgi:hypothetical protein